MTFGEKDKNWVQDNFSGIDFVHIPTKETLEFSRSYKSDQPDTCLPVDIKHVPNIISPDARLFEQLEKFDYIILVPLFNDNIPAEFFAKLKHKNLAPR